MKHLYILPLAISAVLLSSCVPGARISLAGKQAVRTYTVSTSYSSLEVSNAVDVVYSEQADEAVVTADSAVIQYVTVCFFILFKRTYICPITIHYICIYFFS